jgi:3-dehydroquinate dehydratase/shikimate dehydrogenase
MPLKEAVAPLVSVSQEYESINTIGYENGKIRGWNTDGKGALDVIEKRIQVKGKHLVILGAGGSAKAILHEAIKRGARVTILNRTVTKGEALAKKYHCFSASLNAFPYIANLGYEFLINCTPIGMESHNELPIDVKYLLEKRIVMDIISNPKETALLKAAKEKQCPIIYGTEMFTQQAVGQYCHWFNDHLVPLLD